MSRIALLYHSAAGGTRLAAGILRDILSRDHDADITDIYGPGAGAVPQKADFTVFCYPTYFLRPSRSMTEFIDRLPPSASPRPAYLVTTYELYAENSLRVCALQLRNKGMIVTGSAAIRAPGSDLTCVFPDWICPWLYRFERRFPRKLRSIAAEIGMRAARRAGERLPRTKWYTPFAQPLQRAFFDGFINWRDRIRILPDRCSDCGACISLCYRGAWARAGGAIRHEPARCELCTRCIHRCPNSAIVLAAPLKDNRRLDARRYARLEARARQALRRNA